MVEYALILALVSIAAIAILTTLGQDVVAVFTSAAGALAPDWWLARLLRSRWIKQSAAASRQAPGIIGVGDEAREAA